MIGGSQRRLQRQRRVEVDGISSEVYFTAKGLNFSLLIFLLLLYFYFEFHSYVRGFFSWLFVAHQQSSITSRTEVSS